MWKDIRVVLMLHPLDGYTEALSVLSSLRAHLDGSVPIDGADVAGLVADLRHAVQLPLAVAHEPLDIVAAAESVILALQAQH